MDLADLRADVPALSETVYLNTGASGPSPRRVVDAAETALETHEYESHADPGPYEWAFGFLGDVREAVAAHFGTTARDVALTSSTTDGIGRVAAAMDWSEGDVVVRTDTEHAAGILPWRRLRDRAGVEVRVVETDHGRVDPDDFAAAVEGARLATFSSICWTSGTRADVAELTDIAHDAGARVLVDAVQSVGQRPVDFEAWGADVVAAASHKWLLGPWGAGFLYVDPEFAAECHPAQVGYLSVEEPYADPYELTEGARRFEIGTVSPAPYAGLRESIALFEDLGYDAVTDRIERLSGRLKAGLDDDRLVSPDPFHSGLVTFAADDPAGLVERLAAEGIAIRDLPSGHVRASVHAFNTAEDVDALLAAL